MLQLINQLDTVKNLVEIISLGEVEILIILNFKFKSADKAFKGSV